MKFNHELVSYLEDLSCLALSEDEKATLQSDLEKILNHIQIIDKLDTEGVIPRSHPFDNVNAFREDVVVSSFDRELILKNAPEKNDEMFIVPKTVE
ncbi:MAG: Asp-tRNA(Asn)/Glu-tRNA(Gln) amidotransferase subunit GatC [Oscillospiraceae bacterium]|nr:Asp-tRNA(Asn)/Glu-tRNA(Gln) amidotransferase subunit GatC [Oscillospiraceae bacterium]